MVGTTCQSCKWGEIPGYPCAPSVEFYASGTSGTTMTPVDSTTCALTGIQVPTDPLCIIKNVDGMWFLEITGNMMCWARCFARGYEPFSVVRK